MNVHEVMFTALDLRQQQYHGNIFYVQMRRQNDVAGASFMLNLQSQLCILYI